MTVYKKLLVMGGSILCLFLAFIFVFSFYSLEKNKVIDQTLELNFALMEDFHLIKDSQSALRELMIVIDVSFEEARKGIVRKENIDAIQSIFKTLSDSLDILSEADYAGEKQLIGNISFLLKNLSHTVKLLPNFIETRNEAASMRSKKFKDLNFSIKKQSERFVDNLDLLYSQINKRRESVSNVFTLIQVDKVIDRIVGIRSHYLSTINLAKAVLYKNVTLGSVSNKTRKVIDKDLQYIKLNLKIINILALNPEEKLAINVVINDFSSLKPTLATLYTAIETEHNSKLQIQSDFSHIDTSINDNHDNLRTAFYGLEEMIKRQHEAIQKRVIAEVNLKETIYWVCILLFVSMVVVAITFFVIARGINEIVKELNRERKNAEYASTVKSEFLANMSHEIRTPLNGVVGMAELLKSTSLDSEQDHQVQTICSSSELLLSIINDILDVSKLDAKKLTLERIEFDLCRVVEDTCDLLALQAQAKGVEFICRVAPDIPVTFIGDPDRLRQIIFNLGGNAIKFTKTGEVVISVSLVEEPTEELAGVHVSVDDTGIGIPEDMVSSLFEQFTQADSATTRKFGGTGLGLTISKKLVEMMGGKILVDSREGKGSTFKFTVFLECQKSSKKNNLLHPIDPRKHKLLVVDKNETNRLWLVSLLQAWQFSASGAKSCNEALALLKPVAQTSARYTAIIVDSTISGFDKEGIARNIKQDSKLVDLALIVMTYIDINRANINCVADFSASISKPIKHSALISCLIKALSFEKNAVSAKPEEKKIINEPRNTVDMLSTAARILLVDDNHVNRDVALGMLKYLGVSAETAENGRKAVESVAKSRYDMIFMDVMMPIMDGFEATRAIRLEESGHNRVPIVAMTGNALKGDKEKCLDAGMDDYITKPMSIADLQGALEKWLSGEKLLARKQKDSVSLVGVNKQKNCSQENSVHIFDSKEMLAKLGNDTGIAKLFIENFIADIPLKIASLQKLLKEKDAANIELLAHSVKGVAGQIGATTLQNVAFNLEKVGKDGDIDGAPELINQVIRQYEILGKYLTEFLSTI